MQEGVCALIDVLDCAKGSCASQLRSLELDAVSATATCVAPLATLTQLRHLSLLGNGLGDAALPHVLELVSTGGAAESASSSAERGAPARGLETLSLSGNNLTTDGMKPFLQDLADAATAVRSGTWLVPAKGLHCTLLQRASQFMSCVTTTIRHRNRRSQLHRSCRVQRRVPVQELQLGANPCCEDDAFEAAVEAFRQRAPQLRLAWKASDAQGALGTPEAAAARRQALAQTASSGG